MKIRRSYPTFVLAAVLMPSVFSLVACTLGAHIVWAHPGADWSPVLTPAQISIVRNTFPAFVPDLFAPGTSPYGSANPGNFAPAQFLGPPNPQGFRSTPGGILIETNGYDQPDIPVLLPSSGTYFDLHGNEFEFQLSAISRSPQNILENYMGLPITADAPTVPINLRTARVGFDFVDEFMSALQSQLANALPAIRNVDPTSCEIVIEPSVMYVSSPGGGGYAGGVTESVGHGRYRSHVAAMVLTSPQGIANWNDYLVDEGLNCFVSAAGRPDLAH
jgi:hypothetical protein